MLKILTGIVWVAVFQAACGGGSNQSITSQPAANAADDLAVAADSLLQQQLIPEGFPGSSTPPTGSKGVSSHLSGPVGFQPNQGQASAMVDFVGKSRGYNLYVLGNEIIFDMVLANQQSPGAEPGVLAVSLVGGTLLGGQGEDKQEGISNFFYGQDSKNWVENVPTYGKVRYGSVYPGVDVVFYGASDNTVEHDFIVSPSGNYKNIQLEIKHAQSLILNANGGIDISIPGGGRFTMKKPFVYQQTSVGPKIEVASHYEIHGSNLVSFWVDESQYNKSLDLVIDPVTLSYSSYLGGSLDDIIMSETVDSSGNMFIAGWTKSSTFQTAAAYDSTYNNGNFDGFISKISSTGTLLISTYLGGTGDDVVTAVKIDINGRVYVAGYTTSTDFPTFGESSLTPVSPASLTHHGGNAYEGFFGKFKSDITLPPGGQAPGAGYPHFLVYAGNSGFDAIMGLDFDTASSFLGTTCTTSGFPCMVMVGTTTSTAGFANGVNGLSGSVNVFQTAYGGGGADAFVWRSNTGNSPDGYWVSYIGGAGRDIGTALAVDSSGNIYIAGQTDTSSTTNIATSGTLSQSPSGARDAFAVKLPPYFDSIAGKTYGTYLGGTGDESVGGIALYSGSAYVIGTSTGSTISGATGTNSNGVAAHGGKDIFIAKLNSGATALTYLTFIGGSGADDVPGIQSLAVDSIGRAWFGGRTMTSGLTTLGAVSAGSGYGTYTSGAASLGIYGRIDGVNTATSHSVHSYLGPSSSSGGDTLVSAVAMKSGDSTSAYLAGYASEANFPSAGTTTRAHGGVKDAFTTQITMPTSGCPAETLSTCVRGYEVNGLEILVLSSTSSSVQNPSGSTSIPTVPDKYRIASNGAVANDGGGGSVYFVTRMAPDSATTPTQSNFSAVYNSGTGPATTVVGYSSMISYKGEKLSLGPSCGSAATAADDYIICTATGSNTNHPTATVTLPSGYTLIGGGGHTGASGAVSNYLTESYPSVTGSGGTWAVKGKDHAVAAPTTATAYVIGLNLSSTRLSPAALAVSVTNQELLNVPSGGSTVTCTTTTNYKIIGGGAKTVWGAGSGQMLITSYPVNSTQWVVGSRDSVTADSTTTLTAYCIGIQ